MPRCFLKCVRSSYRCAKSKTYEGFNEDLLHVDEGRSDVVCSSKDARVSATTSEVPQVIQSIYPNVSLVSQSQSPAVTSFTCTPTAESSFSQSSESSICQTLGSADVCITPENIEDRKSHEIESVKKCVTHKEEELCDDKNEFAKCIMMIKELEGDGNGLGGGDWLECGGKDIIKDEGGMGEIMDEKNKDLKESFEEKTDLKDKMADGLVNSGSGYKKDGRVEGRVRGGKGRGSWRRGRGGFTTGEGDKNVKLKYDNDSNNNNIKINYNVNSADINKESRRGDRKSGAGFKDLKRGSNRKRSMDYLSITTRYLLKTKENLPRDESASRDWSEQAVNQNNDVLLSSSATMMTSASPVTSQNTSEIESLSPKETRLKRVRQSSELKTSPLTPSRSRGTPRGARKGSAGRSSGSAHIGRSSILHKPYDLSPGEGQGHRKVGRGCRIACGKFKDGERAECSKLQGSVLSARSSRGGRRGKAVKFCVRQNKRHKMRDGMDVNSSHESLPGGKSAVRTVANARQGVRGRKIGRGRGRRTAVPPRSPIIATILINSADVKTRKRQINQRENEKKSKRKIKFNKNESPAENESLDYEDSRTELVSTSSSVVGLSDDFKIDTDHRWKKRHLPVIDLHPRSPQCKRAINRHHYNQDDDDDDKDDDTDQNNVNGWKIKGSGNTAGRLSKNNNNDNDSIKIGSDNINGSNDGVACGGMKLFKRSSIKRVKDLVNVKLASSNKNSTRHLSGLHSKISSGSTSSSYSISYLGSVAVTSSNISTNHSNSTDVPKLQNVPVFATANKDLTNNIVTIGYSNNAAFNTTDSNLNGCSKAESLEFGPYTCALLTSKAKKCFTSNQSNLPIQPCNKAMNSVQLSNNTVQISKSIITPAVLQVATTATTKPLILVKKSVKASQATHSVKKFDSVMLPRIMSSDKTVCIGSSVHIPAVTSIVSSSGVSSDSVGLFESCRNVCSSTGPEAVVGSLSRFNNFVSVCTNNYASPFASPVSSLVCPAACHVNGFSPAASPVCNVYSAANSLAGFCPSASPAFGINPAANTEPSSNHVSSIRSLSGLVSSIGPSSGPRSLSSVGPLAGPVVGPVARFNGPLSSILYKDLRPAGVPLPSQNLRLPYGLMNAQRFLPPVIPGPKSGFGGLGLTPTVALNPHYLTLQMMQQFRPPAICPSYPPAGHLIAKSYSTVELGNTHLGMRLFPSHSFPGLGTACQTMNPEAIEQGQCEMRSKEALSSTSSYNRMVAKQINMCILCNKQFSRPWLLKYHLRIHTGEKPFICTHPGCGKAFSDKSNLRPHLHVHRGTAGGRYTCSSCLRSFALRRYLIKHAQLRTCRPARLPEGAEPGMVESCPTLVFPPTLEEEDSCWSSSHSSKSDDFHEVSSLDDDYDVSSLTPSIQSEMTFLDPAMIPIKSELCKLSPVLQSELRSVTPTIQVSALSPTVHSDVSSLSQSVTGTSRPAPLSSAVNTTGCSISPKPVRNSVSPTSIPQPSPVVEDGAALEASPIFPVNASILASTCDSVPGPVLTPGQVLATLPVLTPGPVLALAPAPSYDEDLVVNTSLSLLAGTQAWPNSFN